MSKANAVAEAMVEFMDLLRPMGETMDGYRADLERRGYSPTAAEAMALEFHHLMIAHLMAGVMK